MSDKPLISVIVPVYKVERYLPRCIESILRQTYTNFELILVDDGTPDRSGIICDRYAEKDSRIKVIHKENGGVSTARNAGIDVAHGEWITFVDSDDWVANNYLDVLCKPVFTRIYDLVVGSVEYHSVVVSRDAENESNIIEVKNINSMELLKKIFFGMKFAGPWMKLFSREIINRECIRFLEGVAVAEDGIFVATYLQKCKSIYISSEVIYYYNRLNELSASWSFKYFKDRKIWYNQYIATCVETMKYFNVQESYIQSIASQKTLFLYINNVKTIIKHFPKKEAIQKIHELATYYEKTIFLNCEWLQAADNFKKKKIAESLLSRDAKSIYVALKITWVGMLKLKFKHIVKKTLRRFLEKRRDGLLELK